MHLLYNKDVVESRCYISYFTNYGGADISIGNNTPKVPQKQLDTGWSRLTSGYKGILIYKGLEGVVDIGGVQKMLIGGRSQESNLPGTAGGPNWIWSPAASPETTIFRASIATWRRGAL